MGCGPSKEVEGRVYTPVQTQPPPEPVAHPLRAAVPKPVVAMALPTPASVPPPVIVPKDNQLIRQQQKQLAQTGTVTFTEFKDGEKVVVDSILDSKIHLRMAAINFKELKLQKIIGQGAFGEVIKGTYHGTPVVVKRMVRQKIDPDNIRMFADEIQLMMNLRHPNIVQFLDRGDLYSVLKNPRIQLSWKQPLLSMAIDISRGMAYLHSMDPPIIHRDLKSMNILVSSSFGAKISDFGLSREKVLDDTMSVTGTPLWLPPEMIRAERYSEKADVYSFGIGITLMHMVAYKQLRPNMSATCLDSVRDLFVRCTSDDPDMRPTFEDIMIDLETHVKREILQRAVRTYHVNDAILVDLNDPLVAQELGVNHVTQYTDNSE
ncbi:hypothetical protein B5M09_009800 [Aphanomyces astaci]|uniref:Protein kinase domain-containing protein n=1 Tax=Aphanomyces astaci TaxID=112090 RepID=A0A3R7Y099_APHAT|nr:hypothetical protein B5M09_009800 [Aphanomyces astaci]